ncbi:hypothetical protein DL96DRAFT_1703411 [Flagelloscypha sp. PMI_526]|nr:hypothetical protein DL96DRAFT_1703411 [Flagelloscypha sp. PMI_526]
MNVFPVSAPPSALPALLWWNAAQLLFQHDRPFDIIQLGTNMPLVNIFLASCAVTFFAFISVRVRKYFGSRNRLGLKDRTRQLLSFGRTQSIELLPTHNREPSVDNLQPVEIYWTRFLQSKVIQRSRVYSGPPAPMEYPAPAATPSRTSEEYVLVDLEPDASQLPRSYHGPYHGRPLSPPLRPFSADPYQFARVPPPLIGPLVPQVPFVYPQSLSVSSSRDIVDAEPASPTVPKTQELWQPPEPASGQFGMETAAWNFDEDLENGNVDVQSLDSKKNVSSSDSDLDIVVFPSEEVKRELPGEFLKVDQVLAEEPILSVAAEAPGSSTAPEQSLTSDETALPSSIAPSSDVTLESPVPFEGQENVESSPAVLKPEVELFAPLEDAEQAPTELQVPQETPGSERLLSEYPVDSKMTKDGSEIAGASPTTEEPVEELLSESSSPTVSADPSADEPKSHLFADEDDAAAPVAEDMAIPPAQTLGTTSSSEVVEIAPLVALDLIPLAALPMENRLSSDAVESVTIAIDGLELEECNDGGSSSGEEWDDEDPDATIVVAPPIKPDWSVRARDAPALGLSLSMSERTHSTSSTHDDEHSLPGSFPSPSPPDEPSLFADDPPEAELPEMEEPLPAPVRVVEVPLIEAAKNSRSAIDFALAMQLRPGLAGNLEASFLVRYLMSAFGWLFVLVARSQRDHLVVF